MMSALGGILLSRSNTSIFVAGSSAGAVAGSETSGGASQPIIKGVTSRIISSEISTLPMFHLFGRRASAVLTNLSPVGL